MGIGLGIKEDVSASPCPRRAASFDHDDDNGVLHCPGRKLHYVPVTVYL
jgi:hypothetical protein